MKKKGIVFLIILLPFHLFGLEKRQFLFDHLNTSHGLSSDNVFSIVQDSYGYIWIATSDGLNKYDGYNFTQYRHNPADSSSLINHSLTSKNALFIDSKDRLWIGTSNGISRYKPETDNFYNYLPDSSRMNNLDYNSITDICEGTDGTYYFSTAWGLIFSFSEYKNEFKLLHHKRFGPGITDMLIDKNQLWIASGVDGLFCLNLNTSNVRHFKPIIPNQPKTNISVSHLYKKDSLLYLLTDNNNGILSYNLHKNVFVKENFQGLASPLIIELVNDDLWIGAKDGIYIKSGNQEITKIETQSLNPFGLHSDVKAIFKDNQNNIWLGGTLGGLNILKNSFGFKKYIPNENSELNLTTEKVSTLYQAKNGNLWVGYFSGEIDRFLEETGTSSTYQKEKMEFFDRRGTVFEFYEDNLENLWACTSAKGLLKYIPEQQTFKPYDLFPSSNQVKTSGKHVRSICQTPDGYFWIVVYGEGLYKYDLNKKIQIEFFTDSGTVGKTISNINGSQVIFDSYGYVWMSTSYGLNRIGYQTNEIKQYFSVENDSSSLISSNTSSLFIDSKGWLWIGTDKGLSLYNREQDNFINFNENSGLANTDIRGITEDSNENLWVTSSTNISRLHLPPIVTYATVKSILIESIELRSVSGYNEFFQGAILSHSTDEIYVGGSKGIVAFNPHHTLNKSFRIPVYITGIEVFNEPIPISNTNSAGTLLKHISLTDTIILKHHQNMITFDFIGINYTSSNEIHYAYMLEGLENKWNYSPYKTKVTYGNLDPLTYTFRVKASLLNRNWEENEKKLVIIIKTPFWQKNWFKASALFLTVFMVYLLFLIRINILKKQKQKLEEKVTSRTVELKKTNDLLSEKNNEIIRQNNEIERIALELHEADQLKIRFFMNISHEFRTPLTLILGPLEQLKQSFKTANKNLAHFLLIERNAKRLLRLVNQLLDLRKLETNTMKLKVSEGNVESFIKEIYNYFVYVAQRYTIDYRFKANPIDYTCYFDNDIIEKVMCNLLSNAFKFVNDGGEIYITLEKLTHHELSEKENPFNERKPGEYIKINIQDNGIGIDEEKIPYIFDRFYQANYNTAKHEKGTGIGLSLAKELVLLHKGQIRVYSKKNEGTRFSIVLPVSKNFFQSHEITKESRNNDLENYPIINYEITPSPVEKEVSHKEEDTLILIVDDNYDMREYLKSFLNTRFKVIEAEHGKTGYQKAKKYVPDLIISDIMMPVVDGYAFSQKIKHNILLNSIPLILLTAKSGKEDELTGLNTGADDFITKPFYKEVLLARINTILKNRKLIRERIKRELSDSEKPVLSFEEKFLQRVNTVCDENMEDSQFNVEQLCEILNISQPHLYRKIKNLTDYSPNEFIRILRLKKAARLIRHDADNISQIAYSVGFTDPKYFSKCFKAFFGQSPSTYKNVD